MNDQLRTRIVEALTSAGQYDLAAQLREPDRILFDNEWLQIRETPDRYVYCHDAKGGGHGVAVLAYRAVDGEIQVVGRYERCPCHHDGFALTSLTGMMDSSLEDAVATAVRELKEEAGIDATTDEMESLGTVRPSKHDDAVLHLFCVDVGDREIGEAVGDGTAGEVGAYCRWVSFKDAIWSKSASLVTMVARLAER
jgi:8-oxo-dGTP pyrophosphatase MutT (NUDIX family)